MKQAIQPRLTFSTHRFRCRSAATLLSCLIAHISPAAVTTWSGAGGDFNWSTGDNWNIDVPGGNDVVFDLTDAIGTVGPFGDANNIVDADTTVASLKYTALEIDGYHTTEIPTGVTLTVGGGGTSIEVQSPTTGTDDVVYATVLGEGALAVNNGGAMLYVGQGSGTSSSTRRATLDLSGLEEFSGVLGQIVVGRQAITANPNRAQGTLRLARTNQLDLNSAGPGILLGSMASSNGTGTAQLLELGLSNSILSNSGMSIGSRKGNGVLRFNSEMVGLGEGIAVFRDLSGTGRQANWIIGDNSAQTGTSGSLSSGVVDFSLYGEVDALVENIILGRSNTGTASGTALNRGTLTFDSGTIDTNSLTAGIQPNSTDPGNARGTVNVDGTGRLLVNGDLTLGRYFGTSYNSQGIINIGTNAGGGEVEIRGDVLCGSGTGNVINVANGGVLRVGGILGSLESLDDIDLERLNLDNATLAFDLGSAGTPIDARANVLDVTTTGTVNIEISGSNLTPGTVTLIEYGGLGGDGFAAFNLIPTPGLGAFLEDNAGAVDLVITGLTGAKWNGASNGDWDIDGTANWQLIPGNSATTYQENGGIGFRAWFDDSATGTKTVNLTTALSPLEVIVETGGSYTFTGTGGLSGAGGLTKKGSGSLVLGNSGANDFTGNVGIEAGSLQLSGSGDRLPVSAGVTLADSAGTQLDLNGTSQTLASISGGGLSGGNIQLGAGTLTLTGASSYDGVIEGSGSLVKSGTGNLLLTGVNTYGGGTTIEGGRITVTNDVDSGLGSGPVTIGIEGELSLGNGLDTGSIAATTIANDGLVIVNRLDDIILETAISGSGGLNKNGEGALLIESAQTYGGLTVVNDGALQVTHPEALGAATDLAVDGTIVNNSPNARLELSGGITLAEPIRLAQKQNAFDDVPCLMNVDGDNTLSGPLVLTTGGSFWNIWSDAGKLTIAGPVSNIATTNRRLLRFFGDGDGEILSDLADGNGSSTTAIVVNAGGTWRFAGNNTCTGSTTVDSGTLQIDGSHTTSELTVNASGTLSGTGTLGTVIAHGTIAPGSTLDAAEVTLSGTLAIEAAGSSAGRLDVSGTLDLTDSVVSVTGTPTAGTYILASAGTLIGAPVLAAPVPNYELVVDGNMVKLNSLGGLSPYETWSGGAAFEGDDNGDGVSNGLAFMLGAVNKDDNATDRLPTLSQSGGNLTLSFDTLSAADRGTAELMVQYSKDLGITDLWTSHGDAMVPGTAPVSITLGGVNFVTSVNGSLIHVEATIPASAAAPGSKLFGRLKAQNP